MLGFTILTHPKSPLIHIEFEKKVRSLGFTLQEAQQLRDLLDQHIEMLQRGKFAQENGEGHRDN